MTTRSRSTHRPLTDMDAPDTPACAPSVQLVQPDVAQATQPGLFEYLPNSALTEHHQALIDARPGDRMLFTLSLDVSPTAVRVASALRLSLLEQLAVERDHREARRSQSEPRLRGSEGAGGPGIITRRRRYHPNRSARIQYTFNSDALVEAVAKARQDHPIPGHAIAQLAGGRREYQSGTQTGSART